MKKFQQELLIRAVVDGRKARGMNQSQLAEAAGINRSILSRLEQGTYQPSLEQLDRLAETLGFDVCSLYAEPEAAHVRAARRYRIAVAGTGYVGLSIAVLLAQHHQVTAVDILPEKVEKINQRISPIQDTFIEQYLAEKELDLTATLDGEAAYRHADFVVIAAPTNYDSKKNFFDTSAVEQVIELVLRVNPNAMMIIKSTIPVGYTASVRQKYQTERILFSPEFLRDHQP